MPRSRGKVGTLKLACLLRAAAACSGAAAPGGSTPTPTSRQTAPRLVVLVVLDQWPEWAFEQKHAAFHAGFQRLLAEGEWRVGRYPSVATLTGPDHALLGTGEAPYHSGIIADDWWHRDLGTVLEATHDADGAVTSKWLRVRGLGDAVARAQTGAKAVDVALKPRAAILPLGHAGLSIWYDAQAGKFTTFAPPPWLEDYNRAHPISPRLHEAWTPLDPAKLAQLSGRTDDEKGEFGSEGFGATFPHDAQQTKHPNKALLAMPLGNQVVLELATHALDAEQLGTRVAAPDLLVVGLSSHDYVGHGWGQESWEMWDLELRLDEQLGTFIDALDRRVGAGKWAMIVTADHGASPLPETLGGGRLEPKQIQAAANAAASAVLGEGQWIDFADYPTIYFSKAFFA